MNFLINHPLIYEKSESSFSISKNTKSLSVNNAGEEESKNQDIPKVKQSASEKLAMSLKSSFGPTYVGFQSRYQKGLLHMNFLFIVAIYNFVFFQASPGKELYVFFPFIAAGLAFITQYWEKNTVNRAYIGTILILAGFYWDLFVSITFIPNPDGGYSLETLPTIILDILGIVIAAFWLKNRAKYAELLKTKQPIPQATEEFD